MGIFTKRLSTFEHNLNRRLDHLNMAIDAMVLSGEIYYLEATLVARDNILDLGVIYVGLMCSEDAEKVNRTLMELTVACLNLDRSEEDQLTKEDVVKLYLQKRNTVHFNVLPWFNKLLGGEGRPVMYF